MYNYKGKELNIDQSLLDDFKKYKGLNFDDGDVETYLFYHFIDKMDDPHSIFNRLSSEEIENIVIPEIKKEIFIGSHE